MKARAWISLLLILTVIGGLSGPMAGAATETESEIKSESQTEIEDYLVNEIEIDINNKEAQAGAGEAAANSANNNIAIDITAQCELINSGRPSKPKALTDGKPNTVAEIRSSTGCYLEIKTPEDMPCYGLTLHWEKEGMPFSLQILEEGKWVTIAQNDTQYLVGYMALEGLTHFRITNSKGIKKKMLLHEIHLFSAGELPEYVQLWQPTPEKADLMIIVAHPDDELLFMGGMLPYYAGELQKEVIVAYMTGRSSIRQHELLKGLWHCGVRGYPVILKKPDQYTKSLEAQYKVWSKKHVYQDITELYRKYKPNVVVTHDIKGEYGHGAHRATADGVIQGIAQSNNSKYHKASYKQYGGWEVKKVYLHLYQTNNIRMDWDIALSRFENKSALTVAAEAFELHVSQNRGTYSVIDSGQNDNSSFGLYYSSVGEDINKDDLFENITDTQ